MTKMQKITLQEIKELKATRHVMHGYPRKGIICVSGSQYYKADKETIKFANQQ